MHFEIQVKAITRRIKWGKFVLSTIKNLTSAAATVLPSTLAAFGTKIKSNPIAISISSLGFITYVGKQIFEYLENHESRLRLGKLKLNFSFLVNWLETNGGVALQRPTITFPTDGYEGLGGCKVISIDSPTKTRVTAKMLGQTSDGWGKFGFILSMLNTGLITASYAFTLYQQIGQPDAEPTDPWVYIPLILAGTGGILDPFLEHCKKGNLSRAIDTYDDAILSFYRPATSDTKAKPPANKVTVNYPTWNMLTNIFKSSKLPAGVPTQDDIIIMIEDHTKPPGPVLKINPKTYNFLSPENEFVDVPDHIVDIIEYNPHDPGDPNDPAAGAAPAQNNTPVIQR